MECLRLGDLFERGESVARSDSTALLLYERGCELGGAQACLRSAAILLEGEPALRGSDRGAAALQRACDLGEAAGCNDLGSLLHRRAGVGADIGRAAALFGKACDLGLSTGCTNLALLLRRGTGVPEDAGRAADLHDRACALGDGVGCNGLAVAFQEGNGRPRDPGGAGAFFEKACRLGNGAGCLNLARNLTSGSSVERDPVRAVSALEQGCALGNATACWSLGSALASGASGTPSNLERARELLRKACDMGEGRGCSGLAHLSEKGTIEPPSAWAPLMEKGCERGNGPACGALGLFYADGKEVPADPQRSLSLLERGCRQGATRACILYARDAPDREALRESLRRTTLEECRRDEEPACQRLAALATVVDEPSPEAVEVLATSLRSHPRRLGALDERALHEVLRSASLRFSADERYRALLEVLFERGWTPEEDASAAWADLVRFQLEAGRVDRAGEVLRRVREPYALVALRTDARAAPLLRAWPDLLDVDGARERWVEALREAASSAPRSLRATVRLADALNRSRAHDEALAVADRALARDGGQEYDDPEWLPWVLGVRAHALIRAGRWSEAEEADRRAIRPGSAEGPAVAINLGFLLWRTGQTRRGFEAIEWLRDVDPGSQIRLANLRVRLAVQRGNRREADASLTWLRQHERDGVAALQDSLVYAGRVDEASRLLCARLADAGRRPAALLEVQEWEDPALKLTPAVEERRRRWTSLLSRPEVRQAIARVGKVERHRLEPH